MPVFLMAACFADDMNLTRFTLAFLVIHFLLYPASNAFNSYYDRDTGSIGGLKNPPAVDRELLPVSLMLDCLAVICGCFLSWQFAAAVLFYGICSKIYSHDKIRLKKRPVLSWLGTGIVQGGFVFLVAYFAIQGKSVFFMPPVHVAFASLLISLIVMGSYPLTQIYQHEADGQRGDTTISMLLGIRGTFIVSGLILLISAVGFCWLLADLGKAVLPLLFAVLQLHTAFYLLHWFKLVLKDEKNADYEHAMRMNAVSATGMNLFCVLFLVIR
jgi:1,4-dihydroxy-2-naphthoate octaprenyltransferase